MTHVYMITETNSETYKIGIARDPRKRLGQLQIGNPKKLTLAGSFLVNKSIEVERYLHKKLHKSLIRGEWFSLTDYQYSLIFCRLADLAQSCDCCPSFKYPYGKKTKEVV